VLTTPEELLDFAVLFSRVSLDSFRHLDGLQQQLSEFLGFGNPLRRFVIAPPPYVGPALTELTKEDLRVLQQDVLTMLRPAAARTSAWEIMIGTGAPVARLVINAAILTVASHENRCVYGITGVSVHDAVLHLLWQALQAVPHDQLRACPNQTCGRLFLRRRRQLFCSKACLERERARRYYLRHKDDPKRRRARRRQGRLRYLKRMEQKRRGT
jgi:hypothetical protein